MTVMQNSDLNDIYWFAVANWNSSAVINYDVTWDMNGYDLDSPYFGVYIDNSNRFYFPEATGEVKFYQRTGTVTTLGTTAHINYNGTLGPVISSQQLSDYAITTGESTTASCSVSNMTATDEVYVEINGKVWKMGTTDNATYTKSIYGGDIGLCSSQTAKFTAVNAYGMDQEDSASSLTVSSPTGGSVKDLRDIKEELLVTLRNNLHSSDPRTRMTLGSQLFTAGSDSTIFTLTKAYISAVSGVQVKTTPLSGAEYSTNYYNANPGSYPTITTLNTVGTGSTVLVYYWSGTEWIYPDMPRADLGMNSYPRIAFDVISVSREPYGIGGTSFKNEYLAQINAYADKNSTVDELIHKAGSVFMKTAKNFKNWQFIYPSNLTPTIKGVNGNEKLSFKSQDFVIKGVYDEI
jgi:hypothetical protein